MPDDGFFKVRISTIFHKINLCIFRDDSSQEFGKIKRSLPRDETTVSRLTEVVEQFDLMNLREPLLRGIYGYGCEHPSDIQQRALRPCIEGYDVIVQSQSGTGKTINAIIAILQQLNTECKDCQALILAPIRELAQGVDSSSLQNCFF